MFESVAKVEERTKHRESVFAVVATTHFLLLLDLTTKHVVPLESHRPGYYGISWFPRSENLILTHSRAENITFADIASYALSEVGVVSCGHRVTHGFLSAPHQALCGSDGRIICTNTGRNAIAAFDFDRPDCIQEAKLSEARWDRFDQRASGDHLNSVFEKEGSLYVLAHGFESGSRLAKLTYPGLKLVENTPIGGISGLHNIWIDDEGRKISCYSEIGALIELESKEILWEAGSPVYTRGLAASSSFVLVGESERGARDSRRNSMSGLWMLDRRTWRTLDYFPLGPFGQVYEVRLLNEVDHAHHGHVFGGMDKLLQSDFYREIAEKKFEANRKVNENRNAWIGFENRFGAPVADERGGRGAGRGNLCLVTQPASAGKSEWELLFGYSFAKHADEAHVAVVSYRGRGADVDMHALLISPVEGRSAALQLWSQADGAWTLQSTLQPGEIPLIGEIRVRADSSKTEFFVDDNLIATVPIEQFPWQRGQFGIRWLGATIYPPRRVKAENR